jgi:hypothetical protein
MLFFFNCEYMISNMICDIKSNNSNTGYSRHVLDTYVTVEDNMDGVRIGNEGQYLNTLEKYYIHKISREKLHTNDTHRWTQSHIWWTTKNIWCTHFPHNSPLPTNTVTKHINTDDTMLYTHVTDTGTPHTTQNMQEKTSNNQSYKKNSMVFSLLGNYTD